MLLPLALRAEASARTAYSTGATSNIEWLELLELRLHIRTLAAEARATSDIELAELEALAGVEFAQLDTQESDHG